MTTLRHWQGLDLTGIDDRKTREALSAISLYLHQTEKAVSTAGSGGAGGGVAGASFLTIVNESVLTGERALAVQSPITKSDAGPNSSLTIGIGTAAHSGGYGTADAAGSAGSVIRSDAVFRYPGATMSALGDPNGQTVLYTDTDFSGAPNIRLHDSTTFPSPTAGTLFFDVPGVTIDVAGSTSFDRMVIQGNPVYNSYLLTAAWANGTPLAAAPIGCWRARFNGLSAQLSGNVIAGYDSDIMNIIPSAGSTGVNNFYGIRIPALNIRSTNALWSEVITGRFIGGTRFISSYKADTQATLYVEPPTGGKFKQDGVTLSPQYGMLFAPQASVAEAATPRYMIYAKAHNGGTAGLWSALFEDRVEIQSTAGHAQTALNLRQLATGATAGAHLNLDNKAGDPPAPVAGDIWRNGDALWFRQAAGNIDLTLSGGVGTVDIKPATITAPYDSYDYSEIVTDAAVTGSSQILLGWGATTVDDENTPDMEDINFQAVAGSGQFTAYISASNDNAFGGQFRLNYLVG